MSEEEPETFPAWMGINGMTWTINPRELRLQEDLMVLDWCWGRDDPGAARVILGWDFRVGGRPQHSGPGGGGWTSIVCRSNDGRWLNLLVQNGGALLQALSSALGEDESLRSSSSDPADNVDQTSEPSSLSLLRRDRHREIDGLKADPQSSETMSADDMLDSTIDGYQPGLTFREALVSVNPSADCSRREAAHALGQKVAIWEILFDRFGLHHDSQGHLDRLMYGDDSGTFLLLAERRFLWDFPVLPTALPDVELASSLIRLSRLIRTVASGSDLDCACQEAIHENTFGRPGTRGIYERSGVFRSD